MKKKDNYLLLWVIGLTLIATINLLGWAFWQHHGQLWGRPVIRNGDPEVRILLVTSNIGCGHQVVSAIQLPESELKNIGRLYQGWNIGEKQGNTLTLTKTVRGFCAICKREEFLGVYKEKVAIYHGRPQRPGPVKEVTTVGIEHLPEQEKQDLNVGIVIHDSREKLQLLEGLSSLQEE